MTSSSRRWPGFVRPLCALIACTVGWVVAPGSPTAGAQTTDPTRVSIMGLVLATRSADGLVPLTEDPVLADEAQRWAQSMADQGVLQHSPNLARLLGMGFDRAGENVARGGPSLEAIMAGFEQSPAHRLNLHDPGWTSMGVGAAWAGDRRYVVVLFGQRSVPPSPPVPKRVRVVVRHLESSSSSSSTSVPAAAGGSPRAV